MLQTPVVCSTSTASTAFAQSVWRDMESIPLSWSSLVGAALPPPLNPLNSLTNPLARIISPSLTHIQFSLVALSFDRPKFLTVLQRAENITSLHITRRPFRRATILSPLLSLLSNSLTHLRLDNLAAEQIPIIGSIVPNLVQLQLDGLIELTACDWGAMLMNQAQDDLMLPGVMGGAVDISDDPSAQHLQKTLMASTSSIPLSNPTTPIFYLLPSLKYLSCTNVERESDEAVTSFMTVLVAKTPLLESLVFSCPHYMMDLWPCQEFWANIRYLSIDHCIITSVFVRSLESGLMYLRNQYFQVYGEWPSHGLQIQLGRGCQIEDVSLVQQVFGNQCLL
ncbi:hypothetical protein BCR33DRAFT_396280 [Rhizoclosmatium globosum]|uniref:Uncharacterized protein n=1 Tax=Rhizoclosmatium globosum TaxID=329046 RepID=A0A1Y2CXU7_9FUNG|nr:hypothetical protein BCR33DRAFT_396280 [Rhizoclosmatium globosum]|eukprot:ORY51797.1 hypothetical protein BCR33DRAFT_396280 [Rhizoclosmatium globosum]